MGINNFDESLQRKKKRIIKASILHVMWENLSGGGAAKSPPQS